MRRRRRRWHPPRPSTARRRPAAVTRPKRARKASQTGKPAEDNTPIAVRSNFSALAAFVPRLITDARGQAQAKIKLPDSLTRYRVVAVAAANDNQFGVGESDVTARLPLMVRPSPPRFLNFGDKAQLPVVIQNQTAEPINVDVALRTANLNLLDPHGQRVTVRAARSRRAAAFRSPRVPPAPRGSSSARALAAKVARPTPMQRSSSCRCGHRRRPKLSRPTA